MDIEKALEAIQKAAPTTKSAQLRDLLPAIEQRMTEGVRLATIHRALMDSGAVDFELTIDSLRTILARYRKVRRPPSAPHPPAPAAPLNVPPVTRSHAASTSSPQEEGPVSTEAAGSEPVAGSRDAPMDQPELEGRDEATRGAGPFAVQKALIAARKKVAATDYSKFARQPTRKASR